MENYRLFDMIDSGTDNAVITIDGVIGGWDWEEWKPLNTAPQIKKELERLKAMDVKHIEVRISSPGGDANTALMIHDALEDHPATVTTVANGICASAATIIFLAGSERKISRDALFLIHKCSSAAYGNEHDLSRELESQRKLNDVALSLYKEVWNGTDEELDELFDANAGKGKWLNAEETKRYGFATEIYNAPTMSVNPDQMAPVRMCDTLNLPPIPNAREMSEHSLFSRIIDKCRELFQAKEQNQPVNNQNPKEMKKIYEQFAMLAALLCLDKDMEYDAEQGIVMNEDSLAKIQSELQAFADLKAEHETMTEKVKTLEADVETLTAERDDFKAKWESAPVNPEPVAGNDVNGPELDEEYYAQIEKELSLM